MEPQVKRARTENATTFLYSGENDQVVPAEVVTLQCMMVPLGKIPSELCYQREHLREVTFSQGLKTICKQAFEGCIALESVLMPSSLEDIEDYAFKNCSALRQLKDIENVHLPSTIKVIGQNAFYGKVHLLELSLPIGLKTIQPRALKNCYSLTRLSLPSTVEEIEYEAFSGCVNMVTVEFPRNMVTVIGDHVFDNCQSLVNISIPSGMTEGERNRDLVDANCFGRNCTQLVKHYGEANLPQATTRRYDGHLIHEACYHSSTTTVDNLEEIITTSNGWSGTEVDAFGMTPFHILATSATLRHDLLEYLLHVLPSYILWWSDERGKRVTDYLGWHSTENSKSPFEEVLYKLMVERLSDWGRDDWKSKMKAIVDDIVWETSPADREDMISDAYSILAEFELMGSVSVLEIFLWKRALNAAGAVTDRSTCRALCGADIIIPNVIAFLEPGDWPENTKRI